MPGPVLRFREFRLARFGCPTEECEDAAAGDLARGHFAIADGTGESSHPGLWARLLVEEFVQTGMEPAWTSRLPALQARWTQSATATLPTDESHLPWYLEARYRQGAYATFLGVVLQGAVGRPCRWYAIAVGDSCLFHVRGGRLIEAFPVTKSADFGNTPWLVGSRNEPTQIERRHGEGQTGDRFWLMTDALAAWFLRCTEAGYRPWEWLQELEQRPNAEQAFEEWIAGLRNDKQLRDDDVTLVAVSL